MKSRESLIEEIKRRIDEILASNEISEDEKIAILRRLLLSVEQTEEKRTC